MSAGLLHHARPSLRSVFARLLVVKKGSKSGLDGVVDARAGVARRQSRRNGVPARRCRCMYVSSSLTFLVSMVRQPRSAWRRVDDQVHQVRSSWPASALTRARSSARDNVNATPADQARSIASNVRSGHSTGPRREDLLVAEGEELPRQGSAAVAGRGTPPGPSGRAIRLRQSG